MSAQVYSVPGQRKAFLQWKGINLSSKLSLTCGGNVDYYKSVHHPIPTRGNREHLGSFQKISKVPFQLGIEVYSLLGQTKGDRKAFFGGCKKGGHFARLPPRESVSFCEI